MNKITRVLIVDDSGPVRRLLGGVLAEDPEIEVVASIGSARAALARIQQDPPDLVTLDIEMPDMNGLELLTEIRRIEPRLPVIMFSALTERAGATTLEALARGATDYVTKPAGGGSIEAALQHVREQLLPKIKGLGQRGGSLLAALTAPTRASAPTLRPGAAERVELVAIGSSTGGPNALAELFGAFPAPPHVPILVVQHMPPIFTRLLAERLSAQSGLRCDEARHGDILEPGRAWVAPGNHHIRVQREGNSLRIVLDQSPPENSCRPAVDVLFRSVAASHGARALGVVLTGMGHDGLRGAEQIAAVGGRLIAQDEASSVVWGMPGFVARAGLADALLPPREIAAEIIRRTRPNAPVRVANPLEAHRVA